jgi:hypothetical protein
LLFLGIAGLTTLVVVIGWLLWQDVDTVEKSTSSDFAKPESGCPGPIPAFSDTGLFYTPEHPLIPGASREPDQCFTSISAARAAGFTLAPPPRRWRDLGGIYVRPAPQRLVRGCAAAAERLNANLLCPTLSPEPGVALTCSDPAFGRCMKRGAFEAVGGFAVQGVAFEGVARAPFGIRVNAGGADNKPRLGTCEYGRAHRRLVPLRAKRLAVLRTCESEDRLSVGLRWSRGGVTYVMAADSTVLDEDLVTSQLRRLIVRLLRLLATRMEPVG